MGLDPVLCVEPDASAAIMTTAGLKFGGYPVEVVHDGLAALRRIAISDFCAIVTEQDLPSLPGVVLVQQLRAVTAIPIILLCSNASMLNRIEAFDQGADYLVDKPFSPAELLAVLNAGLRRFALERRRRVPTARRAGASMLRAGPLLLNPNTLTVALEQDELLLMPDEFALLWAVVMEEGEGVLPDRLERRLKSYLAAGEDSLGSIAARTNQKLRRFGQGFELVQMERGRRWWMPNVTTTA
jgi:DNA-binding response OmpR family regulator